MCGSQMAKVFGIEDSKPVTLKKFYAWYFDFHIYKFDYIPIQDMRGQDVPEIALRYGTVAGRLAESGCNYTVLAIAADPVHMVSHRIEQNKPQGKAVSRGVHLQLSNATKC